jgi:RND family efflux transporter MFP subunit
VVNAKIEAADAAINVAQAEFDRMKSLAQSKAVSQSEIDAATAQLETSRAAKLGAEAEQDTAEAAIENAQAGIEQAAADLTQAELNLEWTVVKAPINGRMTRTMVKRGNLVESGTELVEIVQNDPIWANFNINERFLLSLERQKRSATGVPPDPTTMKVFLQRAGDAGFPFEGHLDYYAPKVDQNTGTMQVRAVFDNELGDDNFLLPGLFVRVRVQVGEYENATLIPERAVNRDQAGAFVYGVDSQNKAVRKNVTVGTKYNGMIVIESGIEADDAVIVDGIQRVRPGAEVDPG